MFEFQFIYKPSRNLHKIITGRWVAKYGFIQGKSLKGKIVEDNFRYNVNIGEYIWDDSKLYNNIIYSQMFIIDIVSGNIFEP